MLLENYGHFSGLLMSLKFNQFYILFEGIDILCHIIDQMETTFKPVFDIDLDGFSDTEVRPINNKLIIDYNL